MPLWGHRKGGQPPDNPSQGNGKRPDHKHEWREVGRRSITQGPMKGRTMVLWVCDADDCPTPDRMTFE